jgi:hypothetical protein
MDTRNTRGYGRDSDTADLIENRNAFANGTPAQRTEARAWFAQRETRMAEMQGETRGDAPQALVRSDDAEQERMVELAIDLLARDAEFGVEL